MSMSYIGQAPVFGDFGFQTIAATGSSVYTMNFKVSSENGLLVFLDGAIQRPGIDYSAGGNTINFADVVPVGVQIFLYSMGLPKSTLAPSAGSVGPAEVQAGLYATVPETVAGIRTDRAVNPAGLAAFVQSQITGNSIGVGQTWRDMSASRTGDTIYQNTTGRPIAVVVMLSFSTVRHLQVSTDAVTWTSVGWSSSNVTRVVGAIIPNGHYYRVPVAYTDGCWVELR